MPRTPPGRQTALPDPTDATTSAPDVATPLLAWYDRARRDLPWRAKPGEAAEPYRVWLSEIMLQQTTVQAVKAYFARFLDLWPTVEDLAAADRDAVMTAWAGLGYYARARNLHACAKAVVADHGGIFPDTEEGLRALPGIGRYTAAAIAAIAFDRPAAVMDANVERVVARLFRVTDPLPGAKDGLHRLTGTITPTARPGDFAQAMMDLGATICLPRGARCLLCPLEGLCQGRDIADTLPAKAAKKPKPVRRGVAWWIERPDGAILLRRRPDRGLLGGMMEIPSSDWVSPPAVPEGALPVPVTARVAIGRAIQHVFTHFALTLEIEMCRSDAPAPQDCLWVMPDQLHAHALPTVMRKVAKAALTP